MGLQQFAEPKSPMSMQEQAKIESRNGVDVSICQGHAGVAGLPLNSIDIFLSSDARRL